MSVPNMAWKTGLAEARDPDAYSNGLLFRTRVCIESMHQSGQTEYYQQDRFSLIYLEVQRTSLAVAVRRTKQLNRSGLRYQFSNTRMHFRTGSFLPNGFIDFAEVWVVWKLYSLLFFCRSYLFSSLCRAVVWRRQTMSVKVYVFERARTRLKHTKFAHTAPETLLLLFLRRTGTISFCLSQQSNFLVAKEVQSQKREAKINFRTFWNSLRLPDGILLVLFVPW